MANVVLRRMLGVWWRVCGRLCVTVVRAGQMQRPECPGRRGGAQKDRTRVAHCRTLAFARFCVLRRRDLGSILELGGDLGRFGCL